ncbi:MAG: TaqI-like C-terminal specificity domain-containing protein [Thermodesulfobacteriota bacterium]|nr:TaqI-like C-terminal specificity domain-containing protein [Thermodesulfobacteriota bacterium]
MLKKKGLHSLIVPIYWVAGDGAQKLRRHMKKSVKFFSFVDFGPNQVFEDVSGRHCIFIVSPVQKRICKVLRFKRECPIPDIIAGLDTKSEDRSGNVEYVEVSQSAIYDMRDKITLATVQEGTALSFVESHPALFPTFGDAWQGIIEATDKVTRRLLEKVTTSGEGIDDTFVGKGVFVLSEDEVRALDLSQEEMTQLVPYYSDEHIRRYYLNRSTSEFLIYSDRSFRNNVTNFPKLKKHIDGVQTFISSSNRPYGLHRPRKRQHFVNPAILCPQMVRKPRFAYSETEHFVGMSINLIVPYDKNHAFYLLGILNSNVVTFWLNRRAKKRGANIDIGVSTIQNIPVPKQDDTKNCGEVSRLAKELFLYLSEKPPSNGRNEFNNHASNVEKRLNEKIYKLYGLGEDEIEEIEKEVATLEI